jgi:hypothetical protein
MKFIFKVILIFLLPLNLFANEETYSCRPIAAAVQTESGHTYHETLEDYDEEALKKFDNIGIDKIEDDAQILDKTMGVENFRVFYFLYANSTSGSALKRISIDTKNNLTAEITLPSKVISGVTLYYFLRACDMKGIEVDFEPGFNKALG